MWARFYKQGIAGEKTFFFPSYEEASTACAAEEQELQAQRKDQDGEEEQRRRRHLVRLANGDIFNCDVYRRRMSAVVVPLLLDANDRAREHSSARNTGAYVHAAGLGLGTWAVPGANELQAELLLQVFGDAMREHPLPHVADVDFVWFPRAAIVRAVAPEVLGVADNGLFECPSNGNSVRVHFSRRDLAAKLGGDSAGKLLVGSFAADANAHLGNEYFLGALSASSASAAASCSTIAELGSPLINARVSGRCARFLTPQSGRRSITEAARRDSCDAHQGHLDAIEQT